MYTWNVWIVNVSTCIPGTDYFQLTNTHNTHMHACTHTHAHTHTHTHIHTHTYTHTHTRARDCTAYAHTDKYLNHFQAHVLTESLITHLYLHPGVTVPRDGTDEVVGAGGERGDGCTVVHTGLSPLVQRGDREITGIKYLLRHLRTEADQSYFKPQVFSI